MSSSVATRTILLITVSCLLAAASMAVAGEVFVDAANTSGTEDGSAAYPFDTIAEGLDAAAAGDTVTVLPGIYFGAISLKDDVRLVSTAGPAVTIIDGLDSCVAVDSPNQDDRTDNYPDSYIEGFTVRNARCALVNIINRYSFWARSTFELHNMVLEGGGKSVGVGMYIYPGATATITRTVFHNVYLAINAIWCPPPLLQNVTFDNVGSAYFIYQIGINLYNNAVSNVDKVIELWGTYGYGWVAGSHNNFFGYQEFAHPSDIGTMPSVNLTDSLYLDPLFVDPAVGDYALQPESPLIDAGTDVGLPFEGDAPDIGAYEYDATPVDDTIEALAESYLDVPTSEYRNAGEQRRNALANKFFALLKRIENNYETATDCEREALLTSVRDKLVNDIWAKGDGFYGGNPNNDWIVTAEEQAILYEKVQETLDAIDAELAGLTCS